MRGVEGMGDGSDWCVVMCPRWPALHKWGDLSLLQAKPPRLSDGFLVDVLPVAQVTVKKGTRSAVSSMEVEVVDGSDSPPAGSIKLACVGIGCSFPTAPVDPNKPLSLTVRVEGPPHLRGRQPRTLLALSLTPPLARSVHQAYLDGTLGGPSPDVAYEWSWDVEGLALATQVSGSSTVTEQRLEITPAGLSGAAPGFQLAVKMTNVTSGGSSQATLKVRVGQPPYCSLEEPSDCIQVRGRAPPVVSACALIDRL